jgi:hypothetical protein
MKLQKMVQVSGIKVSTSIVVCCNYSLCPSDFHIYLFWSFEVNNSHFGNEMMVAQKCPALILVHGLLSCQEYVGEECFYAALLSQGIGFGYFMGKFTHIFLRFWFN